MSLRGDQRMNALPDSSLIDALEILDSVGGVVRGFLSVVGNLLSLHTEYLNYFLESECILLLASYHDKLPPTR